MKARFFVEETLVAGSSATIRGEEFHHAVRVARLKAGEQIELIARDGRAARASVTSIGPDTVTARVEEILPSREASLKIILAPALIQIEKFELVLQKGTELGVHRFVPLLTARTEVRPERVAGKRERWEKIVLEAVKQSGRSAVPVVEAPITFQELLRREGPKVLLDAGRLSTPAEITTDVTLLIGPEGGWSEKEIEQALVAGTMTQRVGPRRLRAETAAIVAVTWFGAKYGDLN